MKTSWLMLFVVFAGCSQKLETQPVKTVVQTVQSDEDAARKSWEKIIARAKSQAVREEVAEAWLTQWKSGEKPDFVEWRDDIRKSDSLKYKYSGTVRFKVIMCPTHGGTGIFPAPASVYAVRCELFFGYKDGKWIFDHGRSDQYEMKDGNKEEVFGKEREFSSLKDDYYLYPSLALLFGID